MKNNIGKLSNFVSHKYTILKDINKMILNVINKCQQQIKQSIDNSSMAIQLKTVPLQPQKPIPKKMLHWWEWYQHLIGLNSVEQARQKVVLLQDKLAKCYEMRHTIDQHAFMTNNRMKEIYDELLRMKRDDPRYVHLTIEENKNLQEQKRISQQLQLIDKEERDFFVHFTVAINEYQVAQALNAQKFKYLSFLASAFVGLLSLILSLIYNDKRTKEMNKMLSELNEKNEASIEKHLNVLKTSIDEKMQKPTETQAESTWSYVFKKSAYVASLFLMMKGIIF